jgi:hypothetical protein
VSRQQKPSRQVLVDEQIQVVLAVLNGELSLAGAARRPRLTSPPDTAVSVWPLADPLPDREVPT